MNRTNKLLLLSLLIGAFLALTAEAVCPWIAARNRLIAERNRIQDIRAMPMIDRVFCWNIAFLRISQGGSVASAINYFRSSARDINVQIEVENEKEFFKRYQSPDVDFKNMPLGEAIYEFAHRMGAKCYFLDYHSKILITHPDMMEVKTEMVNGITWSYVMIGGDVFLGDCKNTAIDRNQLLALWKDNRGKVVIPAKLGGKDVVGINTGALCFRNLSTGEIKDFGINEDDTRLDFEIPKTVKYVDENAFSDEKLAYLPVAVARCPPPVGWMTMGGLKYCQVNQKDGWGSGMLNEARFLDTKPWRRKKKLGNIEWSYDVLEVVHLGAAQGPAIPTSTAGKLKIPMSMDGRPVVIIGEDAFKDCAKLTAIEVPTKVAHIRKDAFSGCKAVKEIVISSTELETIDSEVFADLPSLKKVIFLGKMPREITGENDFFTLGKSKNVKFEIKNKDSWRSAFLTKMTKEGWKGVPKGRGR